MKVLFYYPDWSNRWIPYLEKELSRYKLMVFNAPADKQFSLKDLAAASEQADVLVSSWCDSIVGYWTKHFPKKKIITWLRRYELWEPRILDKIDFSAVDAMIFVSKYYQDKFAQGYGKPRRSYLIHNGIDISAFPFKVRGHGHKIAMMFSIKNVKNMPLAGMILRELPKEYKIYHVGLPFDSQISGQLFSYLDNLGVLDRFVFEGTVAREDVPAWLDDKNYILSTSINEGCPNNVIEAMAMGIKPVVHNWPGAYDQFPDGCVFNKVDEAVEKIAGLYVEDQGKFYGYDKYDSQYYHDWVKDRFSLRNFQAVHEVIAAVANSSGDITTS